MHDLIGDIHDHADALQQLLKTLGYERRHGVYRHPDRQAIFLGDFIDRGPKIRETLEIVRPMLDSGAALAVMGNHELNALAFHTPDPRKPGEHLRPHNEKNSHQLAETMRQVPAGELASYLAWFRTLPLWLDLDGLRVVHACWDETPGATFRDKDGHERLATRVKWYKPPDGHTFRTYAMASEPIESDLATARRGHPSRCALPRRRQTRVRWTLLAHQSAARATPPEHRLRGLERGQGRFSVCV
jgi:hypothetical protein